MRYSQIFRQWRLGTTENVSKGRTEQRRVGGHDLSIIKYSNVATLLRAVQRWNGRGRWLLYNCAVAGGFVGYVNGFPVQQDILYDINMRRNRYLHSSSHLIMSKGFRDVKSYRLCGGICCLHDWGPIHIYISPPQSVQCTWFTTFSKSKSASHNLSFIKLYAISPPPKRNPFNVWMPLCTPESI